MENRKRGSSYKKHSDKGTGKRSFRKDDNSFKKDGPKREFKRTDSEDTGKPKHFSKGPRASFGKPRFKDSHEDTRSSFDKPARFKKEGSDENKRPFRREGGFKKEYNDREKRPFKRFDNDRPARTSKDFNDRSERHSKDFSDRSGRTSFNKPSRFKKDQDTEKKPFRRDTGYKKPGGAHQLGLFDEREQPKKEFTKRGATDRKTGQPLKFHKFTKFDKEEKEAAAPEKAMTLNKYIAHSGECSRREAAEMVKQGKVKVNGELVLEPGYRVMPDDKVTFAGKKLTPTKNFVYVLLNKPKGYITTTDDPQERATVMDLVEGVDAGRLYPVGRLDRNTSGLLLLTNDGDLAQKLSHPSYETKKVYQVSLDRPLEREDFEKIRNGVELEDGKAKVDAIEYLEKKNEIGLEIHSGKNRIVRRIFESLRYDVEKLDRVMYAGLTKKNLPRGKWRLLTEKELVFLKHFKSK
jgi:23S rRNA pseudouridine2605 synthase